MRSFTSEPHSNFFIASISAYLCISLSIHEFNNSPKHRLIMANRIIDTKVQSSELKQNLNFCDHEAHWREQKNNLLTLQLSPSTNASKLGPLK